MEFDKILNSTNLVASLDRFKRDMAFQNTVTADATIYTLRCQKYDFRFDNRRTAVRNNLAAAVNTCQRVDSFVNLSDSSVVSDEMSILENCRNQL